VQRQRLHAAFHATVFEFSKLELLKFLDTKAQELSSVELTVFAHRAKALSRGPDGLQKVKNLIRQMIDQKQASLASSTTEAEYCKKEMPKAVAELKNLKEEMDARAASHDDLEAKQAQLSEDATTLATQVAKIRKNLTAEESIRDEQAAVYAKKKAEYEKALASGGDAKEEQQIEVEREEASRDIAFRRLKNQDVESIQQKEEEAKKIQSDLTKMKVTMAELERDSQMQQDVLDSAKTYKKQLDKQCIVRTESDEERNRRRNEVISSMKDAYHILNGED